MQLKLNIFSNFTLISKQLYFSISRFFKITNHNSIVGIYILIALNSDISQKNKNAAQPHFKYQKVVQMPP